MTSETNDGIVAVKKCPVCGYRLTSIQGVDSCTSCGYPPKPPSPPSDLSEPSEPQPLTRRQLLIAVIILAPVSLMIMLGADFLTLSVDPFLGWFSIYGRLGLLFSILLLVVYFFFPEKDSTGQ